MTVVFVSGDLMFGSQLSFAAQRVGAQLVTAPHLALLREKLVDVTPRLAVLDLQAAGRELAEIVALLKSLQPVPTVIAFGPHVNESLLAQAQALGCDRVLTRGQFHQQLTNILQEFAG